MISQIKHALILLVGMSLFPNQIFSQGGTVRDSSIFAPMVSMNYGFYLPGGDLSDRFGPNSAIGVSANFKLKSQWILGFDYGFHFSNLIKENDILAELQTSEGYILNNNGDPANVVLFHRGHTAKLNFGRLLPVIGPNPNSGLVFILGLGFWSHKIRIDTNRDLVPQLSGDLKKGYDRLSSGLLINQFIGYYHLSNSKLVNFFIGIDLNQGINQGRRTYFIDDMQMGQKERFDMQFGLKTGWILPIYKRSPDQFYRY